MKFVILTLTAVLATSVSQAGNAKAVKQAATKAAEKAKLNNADIWPFKPRPEAKAAAHQIENIAAEKARLQDQLLKPLGKDFPLDKVVERGPFGLRNYKSLEIQDPNSRADYRKTEKGRYVMAAKQATVPGGGKVQKDIFEVSDIDAKYINISLNADLVMTGKRGALEPTAPSVHYGYTGATPTKFTTAGHPGLEGSPVYNYKATSENRLAIDAPGPVVDAETRREQGKVIVAIRYERKLPDSQKFEIREQQYEVVKANDGSLVGKKLGVSAVFESASKLANEVTTTRQDIGGSAMGIR